MAKKKAAKAAVKKNTSKYIDSKWFRSTAKVLLERPGYTIKAPADVSVALEMDLFAKAIDFLSVLMAHVMTSKHLAPRVTERLNRRPTDVAPDNYIEQISTEIISSVDWAAESISEETECALHGFVAVQETWDLLQKLEEIERSESLRSIVAKSILMGWLHCQCRIGIDRGDAIESGVKNAVSRDNAKIAVTKKKAVKIADAEAEFNRLMAGQTSERMKTSTLKNMAKMKGEDGKSKYGCLRTLIKYEQAWNGAESPELH